MTERVFYSWQSDLPNRTNRAFIQKALEKAIKNGDWKDVDLDPVVDRDTQGAPGSPHIADTILDKIDKASAFVADVSLITSPDAPRQSPNPNVLVELGYALKSLGSNRIIMVLNSSSGRVEDLPFDLRFKRILQYEAPQEGKDLSESRNSLARQLERGLQAIFSFREQTSRDRKLEPFLSSLAAILADVIIFADEWSERRLQRWADEIASSYQEWAGRLRALAADEAAEMLVASVKIEELAAALERVARHRGYFGDSLELAEKFSSVYRKATELKSTLVDQNEISESSRLELGDALADHERRAIQLVNRAWSEREGTDHAVGGQVIAEASEMGHRLQQIALSKLPGLDEDLRGELFCLGRSLHLLEVDTSMEVGGHQRRILAAVVDHGRKVSPLVGKVTAELAKGQP